ncbi:MAG: hypothetical protein GXO76_12110 [Calditrichaeota bacterium]|nr:hypothetical protein [Calditrichota bacterium]
MKQPIRRLGLIVLALSLGLLTGCFDYSQRIVLYPDGSGTLDVQYRAPINKLLEVGDPRFPTQPYEIQRIIQKNYTSRTVHLDSLRIDRRSHSIRVFARFSFQNISDLNALRQFKNQEYRLINNGNQLTYEQIVHMTSKDWIQGSTLFDSGIRLAFKRDMTQKIKVRFEVQMPSPIDSTNASYQIAPRRAVWHFRLSELLKKGTTHLKAASRKQRTHPKAVQ